MFSLRYWPQAKAGTSLAAALLRLISPRPIPRLAAKRTMADPQTDDERGASAPLDRRESRDGRRGVTDTGGS